MLKIKLPLIWKIIIACLLGIAFGKILPLCFVKCFVTFNDFFAQFIAFLVPLIILGLVTPAIYRLGDKAGRLLLGSVLLAYFSTIIAGFFSYGVSINLFPHFIEADTTTAISKSATAIEPYFKIPFPPLLDVMSALVTAFIFGIFLTFTQGKNLQGFFNELEEIDQYVSALKTRKESTRMIMVDFFQFLSNKKGIEYCSCLENQRFFDYPFERQLAIAKFLHKKEHRKRLKQNSAFQEERFLKIC